MTHISTNATSASTSSSRCTATCRCCTRSSAWTLFFLRLVYPTTRPSASSSSSVGAECHSNEPKAEWIEGLEVFKQAALQALMKIDGWREGLLDKSTEGKFGVRIFPRSIDELTLNGLQSNPQLQWKFEEWKLKGNTANKISLFSGCHSSFFMFFNHAQSSTTTDVICAS